MRNVHVTFSFHMSLLASEFVPPVSRSQLLVSRSPFSVRGCRFLVHRSAVAGFSFAVLRSQLQVPRPSFVVAGFLFAVRNYVRRSPFVIAGFSFLVHGAADRKWQTQKPQIRVPVSRYFYPPRFLSTRIEYSTHLDNLS